MRRVGGTRGGTPLGGGLIACGGADVVVGRFSRHSAGRTARRALDVVVDVLDVRVDYCSEHLVGGLVAAVVTPGWAVDW